MRGRLTKYHSNYYYVDVDGQLYECFLKGVLKKALKSSADRAANELSELVVGDWVTLDSVDEGNKTGRITDVEPRQNVLSRPKIANVDQVLVVYPLKQPEFDSHLLDRYLIHIAIAGIPACICLSKSDLADKPNEVADIQHLYQSSLGYPVHPISVYQAESLDSIKQLLKDKVTVLAGPSGAGKSSLMNAIQPDLNLRVSEVSQKIERGQHTTRHVELLPLYSDSGNTFVADTPGFSHLKFDYVLPQDLSKAFSEFKDAHCQYADCLHMATRNEPSESSESEQDIQAPDSIGCEYLDTATGDPNPEKITQSRYASYLAMMAEASTYKQESTKSSQKQEYGFKQVSSKGKQNLSILKLKEKNREASRRSHRQTDWTKMVDTDDDDE